ncbi:MAG: F0F1 ATP synthase subunit B [Chloroflexi bacterium]|nr:F0F1 ATP synthase subunit B [Chloroflexota bacterium]
MGALTNLGINLNFLITQIIHFLILMWLLKKFVYTPVLNLLDERRRRIEEGLKAAELAREEAARQRAELEKQLEEERRQAQARIAEITRQADQLREQILAEARAEAERIIAAAREEAERERERILQEARKQVAELALVIAQKVVGETLDTQKQHQIIQKFLAGEL